MESTAMDSSAPGPSSKSLDARAAAPIGYRINRAQRVVFLTLDGDVTPDALYAACDRVFHDREFVAGMNVCVECRVLTSIPAEEQVRALALSALLHHAGTRINRMAIVALTERGLAAANTFELFTDAPGHRLAVFTDARAAHAWLGVTT